MEQFKKAANLIGIKIFLSFILAGIIFTGAYFLFFQKEEFKYLTYDKEGNEIEISEEEYKEEMTEEAEEEKKSGFKTETVDPQKYVQELGVYLNTQTETETDQLVVNNWEFKGPYGARLRDNSGRYCGLIRDIEVEGVPNIKVAGGTGGLFKMVGIFPYALSDNQVTSRNMGAFATDPNNSQNILLGTGGVYFPGTGLWRTTNEGVSWIQNTDIPQSGYFTEIKYQTGSSSIVLASHSTGMYRSINGGVNWTLRLTPATNGSISWFDFCSVNTNIVYAARQFDGVWKSTDGGQNFTKLVNYPLTSTNFNWATIAVSNSNPNLVYVSATNGVDQTSGIHKTTNGGTNWTDISWRNGGGVLQNMHTQGKRNGCISVSPTNDQLILVGGFDIYRSTNGGSNWAIVTGLHKDQCVMKWRNNGTEVYVGNDGGLAYSTNAGITFSTDVGILPTMEVLSVDVAAYSGGFIFLCGTQDNSIISSINNGVNWYENVNSDGGRVSIDRNNPGNWMCETFPGTPQPHDYHYSTNSGVNWFVQTINNSGYGTTVANDKVNPVYWYCNTDNKVYFKTTITGSWAQLGASLPENPISAISVGNFNAGYTPVYAILPNNTTKIKLYDGTNWVVRNSGLPASAFIGDVINHPTNNNIAACYTAGSLPGQKIYKTTNRGISWLNVSGDFPDLSVRSLVLHPTNSNIMFASVQYFGVYRTTNGGTNWVRWMNGMPLTLWVESMTYMDSTAINGKFYVVAGTHGRGIYTRDGSGDDPLTGNNNTNTNLPKEYSLAQNYPNPFNPSTIINFDLPVSDIVTIQIFDITGKLVMEVMNNKLYSAGRHSFSFDGNGISSGAYFYRITTPKYTDVKKMVLVK